MTIGLMADPGLPEKITTLLAQDLQRDLGEQLDGHVQWQVESARGTLPLTAEGDIPLIDHAPRIRDEHGWDYLIYLTDLPRTHDGEPMVCELSTGARAALLSCPPWGDGGSPPAPAGCW